MATTTNYAWETPDDTDLVKDGAAAIRTLGSSVDTTTKALNPSTTLGDVEYRSATANTNTRLGIGTSGQVLTVAAGVPSWATPTSGGMTLLSTTTLSGASTTISSINQTHKDLLIIISGMVVSSTGLVTVRLNNASNQNSISAEKNAGGAPVLTHRIDYIPLNPTTINSSPNNAWQIHINNYASTVYRKPFTASGGYLDGTNFSASNLGGMENSISAITSFVVNASTGTFSAGQVLVYGVS